MKAIKYLIFVIGLFFACEAQAQLSVNLNIGTPPLWGPSGYSNVRYYYLPDIEAYYDIQSSNFIYYSEKSWVHKKQLPNNYIGYDLYNGYKVVLIGYSGKTPYANYKKHKSKYAKGYKGKYQKTNGSKPGKRKNN